MIGIDFRLVMCFIKDLSRNILGHRNDGWYSSILILSYVYQSTFVSRLSPSVSGASPPRNWNALHHP